MALPRKIGFDDLTGAEEIGGTVMHAPGPDGVAVRERIRTSLIDLIAFSKKLRDQTNDIGNAVAAYFQSHPTQFKGDPGDAGAAATVSVGSVATGAAGSAASVTNAGSASAAVLNFAIPRGASGADGVSPSLSVGTVTTGAAGSQASATVTGTQAAPKLNLSIPQGAAGVDAEAPRRAVIAIGTSVVNGRVTWTYPTAFAAGVVPVVEALAVKPTTSTASFNVQLYGDPTNTSATFEVNAVAASGTLAILGALLTIFSPAVAGTKLHVTARAP